MATKARTSNGTPSEVPVGSVRTPDGLPGGFFSPDPSLPPMSKGGRNSGEAAAAPGTAERSVRPYQPVNAEDVYVPPGRKLYDRKDMEVEGTVAKMGPPTVDNEHLYRQNYAIRDFARAMKTTIGLTDVNSRVLPSDALKPEVKKAFFIKEQRWALNEFIEPDDEAAAGKQSADYLRDYMKHYKQNPRFFEQTDRLTQVLKADLNKKIPLPQQAQNQIKLQKAIIEQTRQLSEKREQRKNSLLLSGSKQAQAPAHIPDDDSEKKSAKIHVKQKPRFKTNPRVAKKIKIGQPIFQREVQNARIGYIKLLEKLTESEMCIRQIKNGQTLFEKDVMRIKYANPYFKVDKMNNKLQEYLEQRRPKLEANPNINQFEEDQQSIPAQTSQTQASWLLSA